MEHLLNKLAERKVVLGLNGDKLVIKAPPNALTEELKKSLKDHKGELIELLHNRKNEQEIRSLPLIEIDDDRRFEPFPLTDVQHAYWTGRGSSYELGNISTHFYFELDTKGLNIDRLNKSLQSVIQRHEMLRAIIDANGQQIILSSVPNYEIAISDLRKENENIINLAILKTRSEMSHQVLSDSKWPLFEIRATLGPEESIWLHVSLDLLIMDAWSMFIFFGEWVALYNEPDRQLPPINISYRDYVLTEQKLVKSEMYQKAFHYWMNRIETLPPPPDLPVKRVTKNKKYYFIRRRRRLDRDSWQILKQKSKAAGITPSVFLLTVFSEVLTQWSTNANFTLNVTLFNRLPLHEGIDSVVGDFTSLTLLEIGEPTSGGFLDRATRVQAQLWQDLDHRSMSGVKVLREWSKHRGSSTKANMPVVFTSALVFGADDKRDAGVVEGFGEMVYGVSQTPQVWLDHQVMEIDGELVFNWDAVEEIFPVGMLDDMFDCYWKCLSDLAGADYDWTTVTLATLPEYQMNLIRESNSQTQKIDRECLYSLFTKQAERTPDSIAVYTKQRKLSYREVLYLSKKVALEIKKWNVEKNSLVGIGMEKGWEQIVAAYGIMMAGAAFLPLEMSNPEARRWQLLNEGNVRLVITQKEKDMYRWPDHVDCIEVSYQEPSVLLDSFKENLNPLDLAYVIFTSGSTGVPKGVMINHENAVNTIVDMNLRFDVNSADRVFAISSLSFDLSIYDIFGLLAVGGSVVVPDPADLPNPEFWYKYLSEYKVTIWNSAPPLMQMLVNYLEGSKKSVSSDLRLSLLSGDWIPLELPDQVRKIWPNNKVISLGGATEGSIWSVIYPIESVESEWKSIPYGKALTNQKMYVLNENKNHCPIGVTGQIHIGGNGVAQGYLNNEEETQKHFFEHPLTKERLYATGDMGRLFDDGNIEFLGRRDKQVKINGHRIELGEIMNCLQQHQDVVEIVAIASGKPLRLSAFIVPNSVDLEKIDVDSIKIFVEDRLPKYMIPTNFVFLEKMPVTNNGKIDYRELEKILEEDSQEESYVVEPRNEQEAKMIEIWQSVVGFENIGIDDNFFEIGGDSVNATQVSKKVLEVFGVTLPLRYIFESPTVAELVERIQKIDDEQEENIDGSIIPAAAIFTALNKDSQQLVNDTKWNIESVRNLDTGQYAFCEQPSKILLTGASGFFGAYILRELMDQTHSDVFCLVRARSEEHARQRIIDNLEKYSLWENSYSSRIQPLAGDFGYQRLGLKEKQYDELCRSLDSIYHVAFTPVLNRNYEYLRDAHINSIYTLVEMAGSNKTKALFFVSSVAPNMRYFDGRFQIMGDETPSDDPTGMLNGYAQCKWVAEKLVLNAAKMGIPATVYRPTTLIGSSKDGATNISDMIYNLIELVLNVGQSPNWPGAVVDALPVDFASNFVVKSSLTVPLDGKVFNMIHPEPLPMTKFLNALITYFDKPDGLQTIEFEEWIELSRKYLEEKAPEVQRSLIEPFFIRTEYGRLIDHYFLEHQFELGSTQRLLAELNDSFPILDEKYCEKQFEYLQKNQHNFLGRKLASL
ncbi:MAG: amino acid adenylation domain-containing protein [Myxococcota bacterium]|nr:amino acid adenylation domain-containing protein [Myxococcota bacterium]